MLQEGIDVRILIGGVDDSNMIARHLKTFPLVLCASPEYLKQNGTPCSPKEVTEHRCIIDSNYHYHNIPLPAPRSLYAKLDYGKIFRVASTRFFNNFSS